MRNRRLVLGFVFSICTACASKPPIFTKMQDDPNSPRDFYKDSASNSLVNILPSAVFQKIIELKKKSVSSQDLASLKEMACNGSEAKIKPRYNVMVILPKTPPGQPLDRTSDQKAQFFKNAERFLKKRFFAAVLNLTDFSGQQTNLAVENNTYKILFDYYQTEQYYNPTNLKYYTPIYQTTSTPEIETYYRAIVSQPGVEEAEYHDDLDQQFFLVWDHKKSLLVPKISKLMLGGWDQEVGEIEPKITDTMQRGRYNPNSSTLANGQAGISDGDSNSDYFNKHAVVSPSKFAWQINGGSSHIYPMKATFAEDLHFFVENYTFIFQRQDVEAIFGLVENLKQQHFGPDYHTGKVDLAKIVYDRGYLWEQVLEKSTELKESPQDSQSTIYEVSLDLGIYCKYGVAVQDVQSN